MSTRLFSGTMIIVSKLDVLARVDADLARGHTHLALQRLASLTAAYPNDLDLRSRRATVYRQIGNVIEAGRWGYLIEQATPAEIQAYERAHRSPSARLRALKLDQDPRPHLDPVGRQRLTQLIDDATQETGSPVLWAAGPDQTRAAWHRNVLPCLAAALIVALLLSLLIVGLITVVRFLVA